MKNKLILAIVILLVLSTSGLTACRGKKQEAPKTQIVTVERGDLIMTVTADGNLDMPRQVALKFGTPGTVKNLFVEEGQKVREGTLLAKLDDSTQKLTVASAQYNVELAMNELVEKTLPALMGYPKLYPDTSAVLRVEQAQEELEQAQKLLGQSQYQEAVAELRLALQDLAASYYMINVPEIKMASVQYDELLGTPIEVYPDLSKAIRLLEQDLESLDEIQKLIEQGNYDEAMAALSEEQARLIDTHLVVKSMSGRIRVSQRVCASPLRIEDIESTQILWHHIIFPLEGYLAEEVTVRTPQLKEIWSKPTGLLPIYYPDTSTSLDWLKQVEEKLQQIQVCKESESCDELELATLVRMAQHDVDMSRTILENDELIFRSGVNLKALRAYNLNLQLAEKELERAKEELMKTEILAPFDGIIQDIGVKENDQLSSFDYSSKTAVHLVDTKTVKMEGVVDEIDIITVNEAYKECRKCKESLECTRCRLNNIYEICKTCEECQEDKCPKASIIVDALPDKEFLGKVTFVSDTGKQTTGVVEFPVTISLEPTEIELKGGLTATADIVVEKHEGVLLLPNRAIKLLEGNHYVEILIDEATKKTESRQVVPGAQNELFTEIKSGLNEGEKVIIDGTLGQTPK